MDKKKRILIILSVLMAVIIGGTMFLYTFCGRNLNGKAPVSVADDEAYSFKEAVRSAAMIVYGKVLEKREDDDFSRVTVQTIQAVKGAEDAETITYLEAEEGAGQRILGKKDSELVAVGEEYIFFLDEQGKCLDTGMVVPVKNGKVVLNGYLELQCFFEPDTNVNKGIPVDIYIRAIGWEILRWEEETGKVHIMWDADPFQMYEHELTNVIYGEVLEVNKAAKDSEASTGHIRVAIREVLKDVQGIKDEKSWLQNILEFGKGTPRSYMELEMDRRIDNIEKGKEYIFAVYENEVSTWNEIPEDFVYSQVYPKEYSKNFVNEPFIFTKEQYLELIREKLKNVELQLKAGPSWEEKQNAYVSEQLRREKEYLLENWADAFVDRDKETLRSLCYDKAEFDKTDVFAGYEDAASTSGSREIGIVKNFEIVSEEESEEVLIRYWVMTEAPEVLVLHEILRTVLVDDSYYVEHVETVAFTKIKTKEQFLKVYGEEIAVDFSREFMLKVAHNVQKGINAEVLDAYKHPVTAAKMLLHLGDGSGEVLEIVHETVSQNPSGGRAYLSLGAGSVVKVRYTFTEGGGSITIPMVLAEESMGLWTISRGDITEDIVLDSGPLYGDRTVVQEVLDEIKYNANTYQICSYGIYKKSEYDYKLLFLYKLNRGKKVWHKGGKLYFVVDADYKGGCEKEECESVCELNLETEKYRYISYKDFPGQVEGLKVENGELQEYH